MPQVSAASLQSAKNRASSTDAKTDEPKKVEVAPKKEEVEPKKEEAVVKKPELEAKNEEPKKIETQSPKKEDQKKNDAPAPKSGGIASKFGLFGKKTEEPKSPSKSGPAKEAPKSAVVKPAASPAVSPTTASSTSTFSISPDEKDVRAWIETVLKEKLLPHTLELKTALRDGQILCK